MRSNKIGPTAPTRDTYLYATTLHICKTTISDSCYIRADRTKIYPKRNYPYVAYCTYRHGSEDVTCNLDYYLPCTKHNYYVVTGRNGDFSFYEVNGTHYKKNNTIKIGDGSYISYMDYDHTGGDVYGNGTITFRVAHSSNGSWSYNDSQHWRKCEGCGQQTDYANHTWSSWINANAKTQ